MSSMLLKSLLTVVLSLPALPAPAAPSAFARLNSAELRRALAVAAFGRGGGPALTQKEPSAGSGFVVLPESGATSAVVGALIENPTMYDLYVTASSSEVAAGAEFREIQNGKPQPLKVLTVPAYGSLELEPGATELVLTGLKRALKEGETIAVAFQTDGGASLKLTAVVKRP